MSIIKGIGIVYINLVSSGKLHQNIIKVYIILTNVTNLMQPVKAI